MLKQILYGFWLSFSDIFNLKDEEAKGRTIVLTSNILTTIYNVFITGIFYTGFLTMYGMSITDTGIITFIPYIANMFSVFSNKILSRFVHPKKVLITSKIIFYALYILATTIMPVFVTAPEARLTCFIVIIFIAYAFYAPFAPGLTNWLYNFYPQNNDKRAFFITLMQILSSIMSSLVLLFSSILTDVLKDSPFQNELILVFRYFAFALVLIEVFFLSKAKDYPSTDTANLKIHDVFTLPFKYPKFIACMFMMFCWNYIANLNNGLWNYHLLNHMNFSYLLINTMTVLYTVVLILLSPVWQRVLRRYSWIMTFGIALVFWVPTEFVLFFMTPERTFLYVPMALTQHLLAVGLNISYANILYMNLPPENSTTHIVFNTIGCNIFAFLGLITGTFVSSITGDNTIYMLGMEVYSVQFTVLLRGIFMLTMGIVLIKKWKIFTRDIDIEEIEQMKYVRKKFKSQHRPEGRLLFMFRRWFALLWRKR